MKNIRKMDKLILAIQSSQIRSELKNNSVSYTTVKIQDIINKVNIIDKINDKNNEIEVKENNENILRDGYEENNNEEYEV
jgi:hypothetical protein